MTPEASQTLIRRTVRDGVARRASIRPYVLAGPVRLDVTFKSYTPAEILTYLPGVTRTSSHGIRFTGRDILEVSRFLEFMNTYQPGLTP
jgi:D-aminopeptidase